MQMMGHLTAFLAWSLIILGLTQGREVLQGMNRCKVSSFVLIKQIFPLFGFHLHGRLSLVF